MFKNNLFTYLLISVFQLFTLCFNAQIDLESKDYYGWFDDVIGNGNSGIYNGTTFEEKYITKPKNHRFFKENSYNLGHLIYDNQTYYNIYLKYDIHKDQLIAKLPYQSNFVFIQLIKEKVKYFDIYTPNLDKTETKHTFYNSQQNPLVKNNNYKGFYQKLYSTKKYSLLKKNHKEKSDFIDNNLVYTRFFDVSFYVLLKNNEYHNITSKKDLIKIFPEQKKTISIFFRRNRKLLKFNKDVFYINLLKDIELSVAKSEIK